jgi:RNA 3'-terminal phosphate cyclase (ATP)
MLKDQFKLPPDAVRASVVRRGFYPRGGGEVHVDTIPLRRSLPAIHLTERGEVVSVLIRSFYAGKCPRKVAERMATAAKDHLEKNISVSDIQVEIKYEEPAVASGSGIIMVATTTTNCRLGGSAVGSPKKSPQDVGTEAAEELCATLSDGGCVDEYLQDQLILYMALANGSSEIITGSITRHTSTAIWTAEQCCGAQFQVERIPESNGTHGSTTALLSSDDDDDDDDDTGRIPGRHRIRCVGIGMDPSESIVGAGGISSNQ